MEEKLIDLADLLNKLEEAGKTIKEGIDSPLVYYNSSAFGFLISANFTLDNALASLYGQYAEMVRVSNFDDNKS